jgi:hypothetical protein
MGRSDPLFALETLRAEGAICRSLIEAIANSPAVSSHVPTPLRVFFCVLMKALYRPRRYRSPRVVDPLLRAPNAQSVNAPTPTAPRTTQPGPLPKPLRSAHNQRFNQRFNPRDSAIQPSDESAPLRSAPAAGQRAPPGPWPMTWRRRPGGSAWSQRAWARGRSRATPHAWP